MLVLNELEIDVAKEILNIGISKSADSLSFFTQNKVLARTFDLRLEEIDNIDQFFQRRDESKLFLLSTELKGELTGDCFLIFRDYEVEEILKSSLPPSILADPAQKAEMTEAIMLELDNIVSASVITQLSNILQCRVYGNVPMLNVVDASKLEALMKEKSNQQYLFCFKVEFVTDNANIRPEFIWGLNQRFVDGVRSIAKEGIETLKKYK